MRDVLLRQRNAKVLMKRVSKKQSFRIWAEFICDRKGLALGLL
jgi:hypothetical protein